jgi:hypothetical protein
VLIDGAIIAVVISKKLCFSATQNVDNDVVDGARSQQRGALG